MDYELTLLPKPGYLHAIVYGNNSREVIRDYLKEGLQTCVDQGCTRVLIEAHLSGPRLPLWDIFEIAAEHSLTDFGLFDAIAYVDPTAPPELLTFIQDVTRNRGLPLRAYSLVVDAEVWILESVRQASDTALSR